MRNRKVLTIAEKNYVVVNMDNSRIACLEIAKTMKSNQLLCEREIPGNDEGFEKENPLNPILLTIFIFYKLVYIEIMAWGYVCVHRILHIGKNSENYTFIMNP